MPAEYLVFIQFILGLAALIWSADKFILSCISISESLNIPRALIGLTLVALGTSLPEMVLTATASYRGETDIAIGNVVGSNISNIGLVFAVCLATSKLLLKPLSSSSDIYMLAAITIIVSIIFMYSSSLNAIHGAVLLLLGAIAVYYFWKHKKSSSADENKKKVPLSHHKKDILWAIATISIIPISASQLLNGGVGIAKIFNISPLIIGLIFMAIGTSLPELATSVSASLRGESDLVIGNIVGSNIFNITIVLGIAPFINKLEIPKQIKNFDAPLMLGITLLFCGFILAGKKNLRPTALVLISTLYIYFIYHAL